jgi:hypothetical protein
MQIQSTPQLTKATESPRPEIRPQAEAGKLGSSASAASAMAKERANFNSAVVQSALKTSISAKNEPLALLYRSVVENLNNALEADFGPNAIPNAMDQDNSPEATAQRIVSMSTGFFEAFKQQHSGEDEDVLLGQFMDTISGGFERGFTEAADILNGLGVLDGSIATNIDKTHALVLQGYADFAEAHQAPSQDSALN